WVDSIPGVIGKLIRRYGWLYGVYTALAGLGFTIMGTLARVLPRIMLSGDPFSNSINSVWYDEAGNVVSSPFAEEISSFAAKNPVSIMGTVIMIIGIVMMLAGVALAVYLKRRANDGKK
ncbi:MAG: hypothetical protein RSF77_00005, partial [Oscillospiraceae bacterium]